MKKAIHPQDASHLEQIPNVGPSIADDLRRIGIKIPADLRRKDPLSLYKQVNHATQQVNDPCLLDVFMAAVNFMNGKGNAPWYAFTERRKNLILKTKGRKQ
ncbi:MAG: TfoX/Sxy family DNA transformation protein [Elusimicrobia bacterium]|nr:TfoX/Sxy family DNA transformation protein [Elusimicrobiota bacterium]